MSQKMNPRLIAGYWIRAGSLMGRLYPFARIASLFPDEEERDDPGVLIVARGAR